MTTITSSHASATLRPRTTATLFERALLRAASALDSYVGLRLARRISDPGVRAFAAQAETAQRRLDAQARGAVGILPR